MDGLEKFDRTQTGLSTYQVKTQVIGHLCDAPNDWWKWDMASLRSATNQFNLSSFFQGIPGNDGVPGQPGQPGTIVSNQSEERG